MSKCEICGKEGYHKMSCPTQKVTVFLSDVKVEGVTAESDGVSGKHEGATKSGMSEFPTHQADEKTDNFYEEQEKEYLNGIRDQIDKMTPSDYEPMPKQTLSIFNTFIPTLEGDEAEKFIRKAESAERATVDWSKQMKQMQRILEKSRIANRKLKYGKGEVPKVKRSKDVEP